MSLTMKETEKERIQLTHFALPMKRLLKEVCLTQGYRLTFKDLRLGTSDERECVMLG